MISATQQRKPSRRRPEIPNPKTQIPGNIQTQIFKPSMDDGSPKPRDLEQRTFLFAQSVRRFAKTLPRTVGNAEDVRQLIRASGSVAANWIEADEALSKKDFLVRAKICRKEAKESRLFLRLIEAGASNLKSREALAREAYELTLIFSAIISKSGGS
ncbi:MAG TPA: four helix bundle protein [Chthoniobacterales bacterium]|nr:four helix bundle protein [Chthoniobacterales bacterium]